MTSNFPNGPDTITNNVDNTTPEFNIHPPLHNQLADSVMAVQTSLLAGGSLSLADHKSAADPHPVYLTQTEGDARYAPVSGGAYLTQVQADARYLQLTGGTLTGALNSPLINTALFAPVGNLIEQRNGTNSQTLRLYNTYIDASNYSRMALQTGATDAYVFTEQAGAGASMALNLFTRGAADIVFATSSGNRWRVKGSTGHLVADVDNTYDIGAPGANRPRVIWVGTTLVLPASVGATAGGNISFSPSPAGIYGGSGAPTLAIGDGAFYFRSDGGAGTSIYMRRAGAWVGIV